MGQGYSEPPGTLVTRLAHARKLLLVDPAQAEAETREILDVAPGHAETLLLLAATQRTQGKLMDALATMKLLTMSPSNAAAAFYEFGLIYAEREESSEAIASFSQSVTFDPNHAGAWQALGDQFIRAGNTKDADDAYARHIKVSAKDPALQEATAALFANKLATAERLVRAFLTNNRRNVVAGRLLAEVVARQGRKEEAAALLADTIQSAPGSSFNYLNILYRHQHKPKEALVGIDKLLKNDPHNLDYLTFKIEILDHLGEIARALEIHEQILQDDPKQPKAWMDRGHMARTAGKRQDCMNAYRRSITCLPSFGEAYWSLANLKTFRFTPGEIAVMRAQLARRDIKNEDRLHLHFALGKALEDAQNYAESFEHYDKANAFRRAELPYRAGDITDQNKRLMAQFTRAFFAERAGSGSPRPDPIFVVGLPRSGSTLIEQILSSHSAIEGTMELPDIRAIAERISGVKKDLETSDYPKALAAIAPDAFKALGEEYLERTSVQRKLGRFFFIDKTPINFLHIGFIHLILPNAKIIDARRHPLGCGFSCFKQHFARGQGFTYSLSDIGRYYADYVELMAHIDLVLPGKVHRVFYERMVTHPEQEVNRLLDYCGLPFEESCLHFYRNDRIVRTVSSEQVRMPIFSDAVDHWRHYEPWLQPLKDTLGQVLDIYPATPAFISAGCLW